MLPYFAVTLFVSSSLLFLVQPMIGKMILPRLGGTPAVWNTCMVFFQAALLVGYGYTHTVSNWRSKRRQLITQIVVLAVPFIVLPFSLGAWIPPQQGAEWINGEAAGGSETPIFAVLWLLLGMVGLPFFVVATSAPLLQKWFAGTGHAAAKDPYFLYGASNLGSMLALVAYPLLVEPNFDLQSQTWLWTGGYVVMVILVIGCALLVWRTPATLPVVEQQVEPTEPAPATTVATSIRPGKPKRGWRPIAGQPATVTTVPAAESTSTWRLRLVGLAGLILSVVLIVQTHLTPETRHHFLWWIIPTGMYALALASAAGTLGAVHTPQASLLIAHPVVVGLTIVANLVSLPLPMWVVVGVNITGLVFSLYLCLEPFTLSPPAGMTAARRLRWIGLAAAPSSLMLGATTYLTTDIAAIPLFWVIPLALYLLTFILVFSRWPVPWTGWPHTVILYVQPFVLMALVLIVIGRLVFSEFTLIVVHLGVFFSLAMVCHGELAKDRPEPKHLTEFYLWMSVGGVLGGMLNALVAPPLFWFGVVEYPVAMLLACFLRPTMIGPAILIPGDTDSNRQTPLGMAMDLVLPIGLGLLMYRMLHVPGHGVWSMLGLELSRSLLRPILIALPIVLALGFVGRPMRFALSLATFMFVATVFERSADTSVIHEDRSFFGFMHVTRNRWVENGPLYHVLMHGRINHGAQHVDPHLRRKAITYFYPTSGVGQVFETIKWPDGRLPASLVGLGATPLSVMPSLMAGMHSEPAFGVIGLGIGTLASHGRPFQHVRFFEIDPAVVRLSLPGGDKEPFFTYLQDAIDRGADLKVIIGDGRLTLEQAKHGPDDVKHKKHFEKYYHVLVVDAFSSDAIPVHLLTEEAIDLYLEKLADGGVLIFNTTNRYVDLRPVLAEIAKKKDLLCLGYGDYDDKDHPDKFGSDWVILQRKPYATLKTASEATEHMRSQPGFSGTLPVVQGINLDNWKLLEATGRPLWTDAYSNLLRAMNIFR